MARTRMVTRTVEVTIAEVMQINIETAEVTIQEYALTGGKFNDDKSILKEISSELPANIKAVSVTKVTKTEKLYGMTEIQFIALAEVLPPRFTESEEQ